MQRPDLHEKKPGHYGGWQALDATPQELSPHTRTMVVGPASLQVCVYVCMYKCVCRGSCFP